MLISWKRLLCLKGFRRNKTATENKKNYKIPRYVKLKWKCLSTCLDMLDWDWTIMASNLFIYLYFWFCIDVGDFYLLSNPSVYGYPYELWTLLVAFLHDIGDKFLIFLTFMLKRADLTKGLYSPNGRRWELSSVSWETAVFGLQLGLCIQPMIYFAVNYLIMPRSGHYKFRGIFQ